MSITVDSSYEFNSFVSSIVQNCMSWAQQEQFPALFRLLADKSERRNYGKSSLEISYNDQATPEEVANDILNEIILSSLLIQK